MTLNPFRRAFLRGLELGEARARLEVVDFLHTQAGLHHGRAGDARRRGALNPRGRQDPRPAAGGEDVVLTLTDLFAGAGGSSEGATNVPGVGVRLAANHWDKAVEVHNANHPDADHLCADISQVNPRSAARDLIACVAEAIEGAA